MMPRSHSASNLQHLDVGEDFTLPRRSSTSPNHLSTYRLSTGDAHASAGAPDEEGRNNEVSEKVKHATIG